MHIQYGWIGGIAGIVLMACGIGVYAVQRNPADDRPLSSIELERDLVDIGDIFSPGDGRCTVRLYNKSQQNVSITSLSSTCGCTGVEITPQVIAPGTQAIVTAKMEVHSLGEQRQAVIIKLKSEYGEELHKIAIRASGIKAVEASPSMVKFDIDKKQVPSFQLTGTIIDRIGTVKEIRSGISGSLANNRSGKEQITWVAALPDGVPCGIYCDNVIVSYEMKNDPSKLRQLLVPIQGTISGLCRIRPQVVDFGIINPGTPREFTIDVESKDRRAIEIVDIQSNSPRIQARVPTGISDQHRLSIHYVGGGLNEEEIFRLDGAITFLAKYSESESEMWRVPFNGTVVAIRN